MAGGLISAASGCSFSLFLSPLQVGMCQLFLLLFKYFPDHVCVTASSGAAGLCKAQVHVRHSLKAKGVRGQCPMGSGTSLPPAAGRLCAPSAPSSSCLCRWEGGVAKDRMVMNGSQAGKQRSLCSPKGSFRSHPPLLIPLQPRRLSVLCPIRAAQQQSHRCPSGKGCRAPAQSLLLGLAQIKSWGQRLH